MHVQNRPATVDDILRLGEMIQRGQQEMARYIVEGLRDRPSQSTANNNYDAGVKGDIEDEDEQDNLPMRRMRSTKARKPCENILSVLCTPSLPFRLLTSCLGEDPGPYEGSG